MLDQQVEVFVRAKCAGVRHSGRTFFEHLKGTYDLLEEAGAPEPVCLAGLCHSIYGTNVFKHASIGTDDAERARVAEVIGRYAEWLAYIFCSTNRPLAFIEAAAEGPPYQLANRRGSEYFIISAPVLCNLLQIEAANLLEQGSREMLPRVISAMERIRSWAE